MDWLDDIIHEKRQRKENEDADSALATARRDQYRAKVKSFWTDLCERITRNLERYNTGVPAENMVRHERRLDGTRLMIHAQTPPPRWLTVQFSFEEQKISCYQILFTKAERHFRVEVERDGTLRLRDIDNRELVPEGQEEELLLKPFLQGL